MEKKKVVVVGASNIDIKGRCMSGAYSRTKNPGQIEITPGGVGRNIAENISRLGIHTILLSAINKKEFSKVILDQTRKAGVDISRILKTEKNLSGIFMAVINSRGDLESSVSDMSILSLITPRYVNSNKDAFDNASYIILDADLPEETLSLCMEIGREKGIPVCVEPVSPAKARVMVKHLKNITLTTPNREELEVLAGRPVTSGKDIQQAVDGLIKKGVRYVIVTLGPEGVYCASDQLSGFIPSISTLVVDSVGAGDALVGGVVVGFLNGCGFFEAVKFGIAAATLTLTTNQAVNPEMNMRAVEEFIKKNKKWKAS